MASRQAKPSGVKRNWLGVVTGMCEAPKRLKVMNGGSPLRRPPRRDQSWSWSSVLCGGGRSLVGSFDALSIRSVSITSKRLPGSTTRAVRSPP